MKIPSESWWCCWTLVLNNCSSWTTWRNVLRSPINQPYRHISGSPLAQERDAARNPRTGFDFERKWQADISSEWSVSRLLWSSTKSSGQFEVITDIFVIFGQDLFNQQVMFFVQVSLALTDSFPRHLWSFGRNDWPAFAAAVIPIWLSIVFNRIQPFCSFPFCIC